MAASLAAAKRRRAPGAVNTGPTFTASRPAAAPKPSPNTSVTPEIAIKMIGSKIGSLEQFTRTNLEAIENKFSEQDKFIVENFSTTPNIEQVNAAFDDLDKRVTEIEETAGRTTKIEVDLDEKIAALEKKIADLENLEKRLTKLENINSNNKKDKQNNH